MGRDGLGWGCGGVCIALVGALSGCPNPNTYTTPRTLDPGKVQWQIAPEGIVTSYKINNGSRDASGNPTTTNVLAGWPMIPSFGARFGVAQGLEIGLRLPQGQPIAADAKIRLLKGS